MSRIALLATAAVGLALFGAAPATAVHAPTTTATTVTCGPSALRVGLSTKVCAEVTGNSVQLNGQIGLSGPPSPGSTLPVKNLTTTLTGNAVGGTSLGHLVQPVRFQAATTRVRGVGGIVPCGSTVHAEFTSSALGHPSSPVTLDVPVTC
ncbi:hypothetical protein OG413_42860 [Streptomyces sp. NBC_01433]|uniref:hypothetical protein n=1 Tax=Streptomyces sp. NBC_01433 TaxID=2903864 RepID=UPI002253C6D6|nr:hypothetical protein [Streptomyces sp. NBC_01433]MCX4679054.1 hypothetical protein [Streptomyces sp. NBC_01433]MCX4681941.1 hypothetical protein [Streptomyces sp. NBC_01433]